jgi:hypothetical protein
LAGSTVRVLVIGQRIAIGETANTCAIFPHFDSPTSKTRSNRLSFPE